MQNKLAVYSIALCISSAWHDIFSLYSSMVLHGICSMPCPNHDGISTPRCTSLTHSPGGGGETFQPNGDLISLAEKGRAGVGGEEETGVVGGGVSSSSASSSGSTTSGDDDLLTHRALRHRDPRGYRQMSPSRSPYDATYQQVGHRAIWGTKA